jgi:hypothetical protein
VLENKREYWRKLIAKQEASRQSARSFCGPRNIGEPESNEANLTFAGGVKENV